ncbi:MAG: hypothetical protein FWF44_08905 [Defluviitaleaceae bacterium]|nr:hypothetical protein [Defluviitaleaceae bacterium]
MTNESKLLTEWVINKIITEYPDDVALLVAVGGASVNGDGHGEPFDYFVPATERGNELSQTFIIGGVGNDLYPRSWERTERTASLDDLATLCLGDAKILYARSKEDEERFEAIRRRLFDNLADPSFAYKKALENLDVAMDLYKTMMFEERLWRVRCLAGFVHYYLKISVACLNGTYWKSWHWGVLPGMAQWKELPENFAEYYQAILSASTAGELKSLAHLLIASARQFIARYKPENAGGEKTPDYKWLADWYQELRTTWNRIYHFCDIKDSDAVFVDACNLQNELSIIAEEFGLGELDLLGCFDAGDLKPLSRRAEELEKAVIAAIEGHGVKIRRYNTLEEFLAENK